VAQGLCIGHVSPEAAEGGNIALIEDGDEIIIDIPTRKIQINIPDEELKRRKEHIINTTGFKPRNRKREVSAALKAYALLTTSAANGAVRDMSKFYK